MYETNPWTMLAATCGLLFLAIGLPLSIWVGSRRIRGPHTGDLVQRAGKRARNPWEQESASLHELADRVKPFKADPPDRKHPSEIKDSGSAGDEERADE